MEIEPPPSIGWAWSPEPGWTSGEQRNICPSQEVNPVQPAVNLKISHFPKDHLRLAVR